jgi:thiol-disulfide isomerase/thioredoxin
MVIAMIRNQGKVAGTLRRQWLQVAMGLLIAPLAMATRANSQGQRLPPMDITLLDGSVMMHRKLQDKVLVFLFWATWCPVCVSEMPHYEALRSKYKDRGLEVLALSLDRDVDEVRAFLARNFYSLPMAMRSDALRDAFGNIRGTPTVFIADRKRIVRLMHLGVLAPDELENAVTGLL